MLVVGLQGSPRRKGNTHYLLSAFLDAAARRGAVVRMVEVDKKNIVPCKEYIVCEKKGYCPIEDDMPTEIYPLLRQADVVVVASPVFFYGVTAQLKSLIDRCQTLWARKYKLKLTDPGATMRRGFVLGVGATFGKNLFEGIDLTARYFLDAISARYEGNLCYRGIEGPTEMKRHPTVLSDVDRAVDGVLKPFQGRTKVLFAGRENVCRSQMAGAFARKIAGDRLDVLTGGRQPAEEVDPRMMAAMQEKGIDMGCRIPQAVESVIDEDRPEVIVTMGRGTGSPTVGRARTIDWDLPDPSGRSMEFMRRLRDDIEQRIVHLIGDLSGE